MSLKSMEGKEKLTNVYQCCTLINKIVFHQCMGKNSEATVHVYG